MCCSNRLRKTPFWLVVMAVFVLAIPQASLAQPSACSAGGSAQPIPLSAFNCGTAAENGETVDIVIRVSNTSVQNVSGTPVTAILNGTVSGTLTGLTFLPVGGTGCVSNDAGVASCTGGAGTYTITMGAGVPLPAGGFVNIATIRATVTTAAPAGCTDRALTAASSAGALLTTDVALCSPQQTGSASGSSSYFVVQCDAPADCTGDTICQNPTCVANTCGVTNEPDTTECRAANGICDPAESCLAGVCPANGLATNTTECRAANGVCDPAESCLDGVCPANGLATNTTECRAANGVCDPAESCLDGVCPANGFAANTTECRAGNGVCDPAESCLEGVCPENGFAPGTTECRAGDPATCNPSESCTGTSATCPADVNPGCQPTSCRTVGYWGTHGGSEKGAANNTQLTMNLGGGSLNICGETLSNTLVNSPASALEGICDSGGGKTQLVRQLIALALNCISSGGPANCVGILPFQSVFTTCNTTCAVGTDEAIGACVPLVDCLNNGGTGAVGQNGFFCATGKCSDNQEACTNQDRSLCGDPATATCVPEASCHDRALLVPDSPASSAKACNDARKNDCTIFSSSCP